MSTRTLVILLIFSYVITGSALFTLAARAQSIDCLGSALVQVIPGATLNVRAQSGGIGQILGTVTNDDGELRVVEVKAGFLRLQTGGWIVNKYLSISCWGFGTPVATTEVPAPTSTPTLQSTPTATTPIALRATPTRLMPQRIYCAAGSVTQTAVEPGMVLVECQAGMKP